MFRVYNRCASYMIQSIYDVVHDPSVPTEFPAVGVLCSIHFKVIQETLLCSAMWKRITRIILESRALYFRTNTSQKSAVIPRRACIQGSKTCASPNSRLESNREEKETVAARVWTR